MRKRLIHLLALTAVLMLIFGDAAFLCAQETKAEEFTLEEITVTAQKRAENQQKVPIAMEVISGAQMAENGQNNVNEILKSVSNAVINMKDEGMRVTLRGINESGGSMNNMRVQTPTVAINFDGAYNTEDSAGQNLFDVERVEVLYGPQSTMYGSNSPGGIVNVVTASPKLDKYSASGSVEYGSFDLLNGNVALNAPIVSDKLGMRLAGNYSKHGSWVKSTSNATKNKNVRLKTLYQPTDDLSVSLTGSYGKASSGGMMGGSVGKFVDQDNIPGGGTAWDYVTSGGGGAPPPPPGGGLAGGNPNTGFRTNKGLSSEIAWSTPYASISIIPSYNRSDASDTSYLEDQQIGTEYVSTWRHSDNWTKQKNADVRLTSPADSSIKWILGGTYYNSRRENNDTFYDYPSSNASTYEWEKTKGIYGNVTYPFTDKFRGTAGYRYSWDSMSNFDGHPKTGTTGITGMDYSAPDYKVGMEYDLAQNTMLFASYATSYRVQAMAAQHTVVPEAQSMWRAIPPEKLKAYTVGTKSRLMENKLQVNTSAFYYDYRNREFPVAGDWSRINSTPDAPKSMVEADYCADANGNIGQGRVLCPDFNFNGIAGDTLGQGDPSTNPSSPEDPRGKQVGKFESYGLDVSTNWKISAEDRLDVSLSYMHTKWKDATVHFLWWWIWKDSTGKLYEGTKFDGMRNTYSPTWAGTVSYEHNFMVGDLGTLTPHVDIQFKSPYKLTLTSDAQYAADPTVGPALVGWNRQEAYYTMDANINFAHASGNWNVNAYVKNATNYAVKTTTTGGGPVGDNLGLNDPRTYGAVLSVKF
jgi:iron complex outermembrane recepter protein